MQARKILPFTFPKDTVILPLAQNIQAKLDHLKDPDLLFKEQDGRLFYDNNKAIISILSVANHTNISRTLIDLFNDWPDTGYLSRANIVRARHLLDTLFLNQLTTSITRQLTPTVSNDFEKNLKKAIMFAITIENRSFFNAIPSSEAKLMMLNKICDPRNKPEEVIQEIKQQFFSGFNENFCFLLKNTNSKNLNDELVSLFEEALNNTNFSCLENHRAELFKHLLDILVPLNLSLSPEYPYISFPSTNHEPTDFTVNSKKDLSTLNHKITSAVMSLLSKSSNQNKTSLKKLTQNDKTHLLNLLEYLQSKQAKSSHTHFDRFIKNLKSSMIKSAEQSPRHAVTVPQLPLHFVANNHFVFTRPRSLSDPNIHTPRESPSKSSSTSQ